MGRKRCVLRLAKNWSRSRQYPGYPCDTTSSASSRHAGVASGRGPGPGHWHWAGTRTPPG
eukprot:2982359-Rhodomonas_salina.1